MSKKAAEEDGELSGFAKAAGVVAGIAAVGVGIAGLFSSFSNASASAPVAEPSYPNNETDTKVWVLWEPPPKNCVKINTDGASQGNPGISGMGGLIRDSNGAWKVGFTKHLGVLGCVEAELKAIEAGLQLALDEGFRRVLLETDSQPALNYINGQVHKFTHLHPLFSLVANINELVGCFVHCELSHIPRLANKCADALANMGVRGESYPRITSPPQALLKHLQADMEGARFSRR